MNPNEYILILFYLKWHLLVASAILFSISAFDDLFIDVYYWCRVVFRLYKTRHYEPLTYEKLTQKPQKNIAILVPCWNEANVIGTMLTHNCYSIDYKNYIIFVGVYPNDQETVNEVQRISKIMPQVQCVVGAYNGPTNKASNLNAIYAHAKAFELEQGFSFDVFVLHDAEDVIHPLSLKLYNYLMPNKDMIQIPVFPLEVNYWNFTHWLYADEFSENHTKDIVVRESIRAHVPSAGVGTAFSKSALIQLEDQNTKTPFSIDSLTEDYHTSLAIRRHRLKQIFVTQHVTRLRWKKRRFFRKGYVQKPAKEYVATRAMFPQEYKKAVRQKARWIIGIVFQEWDRGNWPKDWRIRYTLTRDRKSFITHFINGFGYILASFWAIYTLFTYITPEYPSLEEQLRAHPWVLWLIYFVTFVMVERLLQRCISVWRIYGWFPALLSIPRSIYGNLLNLHAILRAYRLYFKIKKHDNNKPLVWDKTDHHFPGRHVLVPYRRKLGDLLLENNLISPKQLDHALQVQEKTHERLGTVFCKLGYLDQTQLSEFLANQYQIQLFPRIHLISARQTCLTQLPKKIASWFKKMDFHPVLFDTERQQLTIAIQDPTNELLLKKIIRKLEPYTVEFVLLDKREVV